MQCPGVVLVVNVQFSGRPFRIADDVQDQEGGVCSFSTAHDSFQSTMEMTCQLESTTRLDCDALNRTDELGGTKVADTTTTPIIVSRSFSVLTAAASARGELSSWYDLRPVCVETRQSGCIRLGDRQWLRERTASTVLARILARLGGFVQLRYISWDSLEPAES
jgi:hypothetical protein